MNLNEFVAQQRKERGIAQKQFYNDIVSRPSANLFELENANVIKLGFLPELATRLDMSTSELLEYCPETFNNELDIALDNLNRVMGNYFQTKDSSSIKELEQFYYTILEKKDLSLFYFNIYVILQSFAEFLPGPTKSDLLDLKKLIKKRTFVTSIDYKIFSNLTVFFSIDKLKFLYDRLFPIPDNLSTEAVDSAYKSINNFFSVNLQKKNYDTANDALSLFEECLVKYPSYKYTILHRHCNYLLKFIISEEVNDFNEAFFTADLISLCEGEKSTYGEDLKNNVLKLAKSSGNDHILK